MMQQFSSFTQILSVKTLSVLCLSGGILVAMAGAYPVQAQISETIPIDNSSSSTSTSTNTSSSTSTSTTTSPFPEPSSVLTGQRFSCQMQNGQYTVMYQPKSQAGQYFPWASPSEMGGGWSPERRCNEISRRLEAYRPDGLLEMQTGSENGYNTICATTEKNSACRILLTVPVGQDPASLRDRVFGNLATADSGQVTTSVPTFVEGRSNSILGNLNLGGLLGGAINNRNTGIVPSNRFPSNRSFSSGIYLKPYLDPSDGGTGTALINGYDRRQFNLNNFRR